MPARTGLLATTAIALATLLLTACNGADAQDEGASTTTTGGTNESEESTTGGDPEDGGDESAESTGSTGTTGSTGSQDSDSDSGSDDGADADTDADTSRNDPCDGSNTETTVTEVSRPINHMLVTVTNTGSESCDLLDYPVLRFEGAQSVPPVFEDSQPQAVVTLAPGESGYAGVLLAAADGSGQEHYTATTLEVIFETGGADGESANPALPEDGISYDDTLTVTYWQRDMADALTW
ncbi:DUF4232 domain-containing protein [Streptomyces sp. B6B3]|uniref:DUF4232 domain-containing protein n=1 Tax=Streptomyces sp. B6B3 TaxID=3153570 RepID=UPI00325DFAD2